MAVQAIVLQAEARAKAGKGASRALRRSGKVPAIIYGGKDKESMISLDSKAFYKEFSRSGFMSRIIDLKVGEKSNLVLPKNVQLHPVNDTLEHADFMRVSKDEKLHVMVKIIYNNIEKSAGVKRGGIFNAVRREVELICDFDKIPESISVDVAGLEIGDSIHINDAKLPEGVQTAIRGRNFTLATVVGRLSEEEEERRAKEAEAAATEAQAALKAADAAAKAGPAAAPGTAPAAGAAAPAGGKAAAPAAAGKAPAAAAGKAPAAPAAEKGKEPKK